MSGRSRRWVRRFESCRGHRLTCSYARWACVILGPCSPCRRSADPLALSAQDALHQVELALITVNLMDHQRHRKDYFLSTDVVLLTVERMAQEFE